MAYSNIHQVNCDAERCDSSMMSEDVREFQGQGWYRLVWDRPMKSPGDATPEGFLELLETNKDDISEKHACSLACARLILDTLVTEDG